MNFLCKLFKRKRPWLRKVSAAANKGENAAARGGLLNDFANASFSRHVAAGHAASAGEQFHRRFVHAFVAAARMVLPRRRNRRSSRSSCRRAFHSGISAAASQAWNPLR